jgi:hypothetical protein
MKSKPEISVGFVTKHISEFFQSFDDDRDPNRKIKRRIREAPAAQPKQEVTDNAEIERLRAEVATLKAKASEKAVSKKRLIRRLIKNRPERSDEFGSWEG